MYVIYPCDNTSDQKRACHRRYETGPTYYLKLLSNFSVPSHNISVTVTDVIVFKPTQTLPKTRGHL